MPVLINVRHEIVAQELAAGKSAVDASKIAGYPDGTSFDANARRRIQRPDIRTRVAELLQERAARAEGLLTQVSPTDLINVEYIGATLAQLGHDVLGAPRDPKLMDRIIDDLQRLLLALEHARSAPSSASR